MSLKENGIIKLKGCGCFPDDECEFDPINDINNEVKFCCVTTIPDNLSFTPDLSKLAITYKFKNKLRCCVEPYDFKCNLGDIQCSTKICLVRLVGCIEYAVSVPKIEGDKIVDYINFKIEREGECLPPPKVYAGCADTVCVNNLVCYYCASDLPTNLQTLCPNLEDIEVVWGKDPVKVKKCRNQKIIKFRGKFILPRGNQCPITTTSTSTTSTTTSTTSTTTSTTSTTTSTTSTTTSTTSTTTTTTTTTTTSTTTSTTTTEAPELCECCMKMDGNSGDPDSNDFTGTRAGNQAVFQINICTQGQSVNCECGESVAENSDLRYTVQGVNLPGFTNYTIIGDPDTFEVICDTNQVTVTGQGFIQNEGNIVSFTLIGKDIGPPPADQYSMEIRDNGTVIHATNGFLTLTGNEIKIDTC